MVHNFYPRSPCGERLIVARKLQTQTHISIHALLAESDSQCRTLASGMYAFLSTLSLRRATRYLSIPSWNTSDFYPRSPCGERQLILQVRFTAWAFLSTLSLRRATGESNCAYLPGCISIHALLAESDPWTRLPKTGICDFYPRSPCGERRIPVPAGQHSFDFYPRSPCGERRPAKTRKT